MILDLSYPARPRLSTAEGREIVKKYANPGLLFCIWFYNCFERVSFKKISRSYENFLKVILNAKGDEFYAGIKFQRHGKE
jgi:hypothetical protein